MPRSKKPIQTVKKTFAVKTEVVEALQEQVQADAEACALQYLDEGNVATSLLEIMLMLPFFQGVADGAYHKGMSFSSMLKQLFDSDQIQALIEIAETRQSDAAVVELFQAALREGIKTVIAKEKERLQPAPVESIKPAAKPSKSSKAEIVSWQPAKT